MPKIQNIFLVVKHILGCLFFSYWKLLHFRLWPASLHCWPICHFVDYDKDSFLFFFWYLYVYYNDIGHFFVYIVFYVIFVGVILCITVGLLFPLFCVFLEPGQGRSYEYMLFCVSMFLFIGTSSWNLFCSFLWSSAQQQKSRNKKATKAWFPEKFLFALKSDKRLQMKFFTFPTILSLLFAGSSLKWKILQFSSFPMQTPYLGKFWNSDSIRLQDTLIINISESSISIYLIFTWRYSPRKDSIRDLLLFGCEQACPATTKFA